MEKKITDNIIIRREWYEILNDANLNIPLVFNAVFNKIYSNEDTKLPYTETIAAQFIIAGIKQQLEWDSIEAERRLRKSKEYKAWRNSVFKRDGCSCTKCGTETELNAHHIKPFSLYPELRFCLDNGLTLCKNCHIELHKTEREWDD